jgi:CBS domain containing-hemolysin-like protein
VGGFVFGSLDHVPVEGEEFEYSGHRFTVERMDGRRVSLVRIRRGARPPDDEDDR